MFTLGSAIAGGLAGIITARALANTPSVKLNTIVGATALSAIFTVGAAMIIATQAGKETY